MEFKPTHKIIAANDTDQYFEDGEEVVEVSAYGWGALTTGDSVFKNVRGMYQEVKYAAVEAI